MVRILQLSEIICTLNKCDWMYACDSNKGLPCIEKGKNTIWWSLKTSWFFPPPPPSLPLSFPSSLAFTTEVSPHAESLFFPSYFFLFLSVCMCVFVFLSLYFLLGAFLRWLICSVICSYLRTERKRFSEALKSEVSMGPGHFMEVMGFQTSLSWSLNYSQRTGPKEIPFSSVYSIVRSKELNTGGLHGKQ